MNRYSKVLTIILIIVIVAIIALIGFLGYTQYKKSKTVSSAENFVDSFDQQVSTETPNISTNTDKENSYTEDLNGIDTNTANSNTTQTNTNTSTNTNSSTTSTKKQTYKGFEVLGTIEIPKTNLKYPVLAKLTPKSLDTAVVAIYPGEAVLNSVGNVVIAGHNYRNGTFFSNNKKLSNGDKIYITDLNGTKTTYVIYSIFETSDTDTSCYNRDTDGKREITLSTCTDDSSARLIIEAREQ